MSAPERYLRLFDVKKYREIQPVIEGIVRHDVEAEQVISLIKTAQQVVQTDDFKKYNSDSFVDSGNSRLCSELEMIESNGILAWFEEIKRGNYINALYPIVHYICCPKYQFRTEDLPEEEISGTTIDCSYITWRSPIDNLELIKLINPRNHVVEKFTFDSYDDTLLYDRQCLAKFAQAVIKDVDTLSRSDVNLDKYHPEQRRITIAYHLKFYDDFNLLLELANLSEDYTLLCENDG
jgi:hypothetical protein